MGLFQSLLPLQFRRATINVNKNELNKIVGNPVDKEDLTVNSGKTLVLLTEAPTTNFVKWSSTVYESFGVIKKMISTGHHSPDVWRSVLFQLVYAMAVLQKKKIYLKNFSIENNVYIKDIFTDPNAVGSWIYKVDNIEYYVPNFGYILMLDSKYADIDPAELKANPNQVYKIYGSIYGTNGNVAIDTIEGIIYAQFKEIINPDNLLYLNIDNKFNGTTIDLNIFKVKEQKKIGNLDLYIYDRRVS